MFVSEAIPLATPMRDAHPRLQTYLRSGSSLQHASAAALLAGRSVSPVDCDGEAVTTIVAAHVPLVARADYLRVAIRWTVTDPLDDGQLPPLDADLELRPGGRGGSELSLRGSYRPPHPARHRQLDLSTLEAVARQTCRELLERIAAFVECAVDAAEHS